MVRFTFQKVFDFIPFYTLLHASKAKLQAIFFDSIPIFILKVFHMEYLLVYQKYSIWNTFWDKKWNTKKFHFPSRFIPFYTTHFLLLGLLWTWTRFLPMTSKLLFDPHTLPLRYVDLKCYIHKLARCHTLENFFCWDFEKFFWDLILSFRLNNEQLNWSFNNNNSCSVM